MLDINQHIKELLDVLEENIGTLETDNITELGKVLNILDSLEEHFQQIQNTNLSKLTAVLKTYIEQVILNEEKDMPLVEEGVFKLQELFMAQDDETSLTSDFLQKFQPKVQGSANHETSPERVLRAISDADKIIFSDFIIEATENLESIELKLIDLEQDLQNQELINAIFRPFHSIKGVSGFLGLININRLSHATENLLDSARQGNVLIDNDIIDVILEAVDFLKQMIGHLQTSVSEGILLEDQIDIEPLIQKLEKAVSFYEQKAKKLGEILIETNAVAEADICKALAIQSDHPEKRMGEILLEQKKVSSKDVVSALRLQKKWSSDVAAVQVKVDTAKLDSLVDLTGELVIAQSMIKQNSVLQAEKDPRLIQNLNNLSQIVSGIQRISMSMRMVPIGNMFQKMVRLVRDLCRQSGKEIQLAMSGEDTEIDRNVVEALYEPMVHMIRNSADHGIEEPSEREARSKKKTGTISLKAYHKGGNIVIEIQDDGKGLDTHRIMEKAVASELVPKDAVLSDSEIYDLIMLPGFSTASQVTDISGRGVGMDVVKKMIENLRGRIDIQSELNLGSRFTISLPLTMAIIEGMLVRIGTQRYILPTLSIRESLKPGFDECFTVEGKGEGIKVRGDLIALIRFDKLFEVRSEAEQAWDGLVVVVENKEECKGLLVDELLGKGEFVIKSLGPSLKNIKGIAGGAILGDGKVGLILDVAGIFDAAKSDSVASESSR